MGKLLAICTSPQRGTVKTEVESARLTPEWGIETDAHGGNWHRQVSLLSAEKIENFRKKIWVDYGAFGENLVVEGYDFRNLPVTSRFAIGDVVLEMTQIQEGADCDLFISAGQKQMNQLDSTASAEVNTEGLDFVDAESRVDLLENKVVLCVPEGSNKGIDSFDSLAEHLKAEDILFCMGNSDVPVGQYTQKILAYYDLDEAALAAAGVITYGSNVKEVTTQVSEASVDAGVVYCTDAYSAGLTPVDEATKEMCGQVIYPAAVMKNALHAEAAKEFLAYLRTDKAATVFESVGFTAL